MVDGEDDMIIMNGQQPFLLCFEPLSFFKCTALGAMAILAGFVVELPAFASGTSFQDPTKSRCATSHDGAHGFGLLKRKPMSVPIFTDMFAEDVSHFVFHP